MILLHDLHEGTLLNLKTSLYFNRLIVKVNPPQGLARNR